MEFMRSLVESMMKNNPKDRPTADESLKSLTDLIGTLGDELLGAYLTPPPVPEPWLSQLVKTLQAR
jgi:hypothetical protein